MARELAAQFPTGSTLYAVLLNASLQPWNGAAFDATPTTAEWATYVIAMTEDSTLGHYVGTMPAVAAGLYSYHVRKRVGGVGTEAPTDPVVWVGDLHWSGTAILSLQSILTTGGAGPWGGSSGSGAIEWDYVVLDPDSDPVPDVFVWVTAPSSSIVLASAYTDETGTVTFFLDAGSYWFYSRKAGYNFTNPDVEAVA